MRRHAAMGCREARHPLCSDVAWFTLGGGFGENDRGGEKPFCYAALLRDGAAHIRAERHARVEQQVSGGVEIP